MSDEREPIDPVGLTGPARPAPVRPGPDGSAPDTGTGRPLDLSQDPDRFEITVRPPDTGTGRPLDLSQDPDRFRPGSASISDPDLTGRPLDPAQDPDRLAARALGDAGNGATLPGLLGEGAQEGERDNYAWALGLVAIIVFIGLIALAVSVVGRG